MAKTQWQEEKHHLTPTQMIAMWGNTAGTGHDHKGLDADGSCPKISVVDAIDDYVTGTFGIDVSATYFTPAQSNLTAKYVKIGSIITILFPAILGVHATNAALQLQPNGGAWPALMVPTTAQFVSPLQMTKQDAGAGELRIGLIAIPSVAANDILCYMIDVNGELDLTGFGTNGGTPKGILSQSMTYYVD